MELKWFFIFMIVLVLVFAIAAGFGYDLESKRINDCVHAGMEYVDGDCVSTFR